MMRMRPLKEISEWQYIHIVAQPPDNIYMVAFLKYRAENVIPIKFKYHKDRHFAILIH